MDTDLNKINELFKEMTHDEQLEFLNVIFPYDGISFAKELKRAAKEGLSKGFKKPVIFAHPRDFEMLKIDSSDIKKDVYGNVKVLGVLLIITPIQDRFMGHCKCFDFYDMKIK